MSGLLYIVATPIGNLDDISFRAIEILKTVDIILAEDTRHSKKLLNYYDITTPTQTLHEHNERQKSATVIKTILNGKTMALISDSGTPLISDPGYILVHGAKQAGVKVVPIPGANAIISALCASGIASDSFSFFGFLPTRTSARQKAIRTIAHIEQSAIFYESPRRILSSLLDLQAILGSERVVCLAKEISKSFETIKTSTLKELITYLQADNAHQKGEFVIIVSAINKVNKKINMQQLDKILPLLLNEMGASKAARLAAKITGIDKKYCYQQALNELNRH